MTDGLSLDDLELECECGAHFNALLYVRHGIDEIGRQKAIFRRHHPDGEVSKFNPKKRHRILAPDEQTKRRFKT